MMVPTVLYGKPWRPKARKTNPKRQTRHREFYVIFPKHPKGMDEFLGGGSFLSWIFSRRICWNVPFVSCNSGLGLGLGFGFCLNLDLHCMKPGHHLSGIILFLGGERGRWLGICLIISWAILGVEISISYFHVLPLPPQLATATQPAPKRFHRFSRGQQNNPPIPVPNQFEKPSSKTILGGVEQLV